MHNVVYPPSQYQYFHCLQQGLEELRCTNRVECQSFQNEKQKNARVQAGGVICLFLHQDKHEKLCAPWASSCPLDMQSQPHPRHGPFSHDSLCSGHFHLFFLKVEVPVSLLCLSDLQVQAQRYRPIHHVLLPWFDGLPINNLSTNTSELPISFDQVFLLFSSLMGTQCLFSSLNACNMSLWGCVQGCVQGLRLSNPQERPRDQGRSGWFHLCSAKFK